MPCQNTTQKLKEYSRNSYLECSWVQWE